MGTLKGSPKMKSKKNYVLVRTYSAGVHVGELVSRKGKEPPWQTQALALLETLHAFTVRRAERAEARERAWRRAAYNLRTAYVRKVGPLDEGRSLDSFGAAETLDGED